MSLYQEILVAVLQHEQVHVTFPNLEIDAAKIVELKCYQALKNIKAIIEDDSLEDADCFMRIEEIVCQLEELGSNGGSRHDF